MKLVVIESPYAGDINVNVAYAKRAMADSLKRGEAPMASHLLYAQPGILDDNVPNERKLGIESGFAWWIVAELIVFYADYGWSCGMLAALWRCIRANKPFKIRMLDRNEPRLPECFCEDMERMLRDNYESNVMGKTTTTITRHPIREWADQGQKLLWGQ